MNKDVAVNVRCGKFVSAKEFEQMLKDYGISDNDYSTFLEREGCVFCCEAEHEGRKGMALFY